MKPKPDWATRMVNGQISKLYHRPTAHDMEVIAIKLLRRREAKWKRAMDQLTKQAAQSKMDGIMLNTYTGAFDDLLDAMKETR